MEWESLDPIVKIVPRVQAAVYVNSDGKPRIRVTMSETMAKECGEPEKADVHFGVSDGVAMLRLSFHGGGKFNVGGLGRGGYRIQSIPAKAPVPDGAREAEACEVQSKDNKAAVIILPLEAWAKQLDGPKPAILAPLKVAASVPKQEPATPKLDSAAYLKTKGLKCSKLAGNWWMLEGERVPAMDILFRVNGFRRAAGLPSLTVDQIE